MLRVIIQRSVLSLCVVAGAILFSAVGHIRSYANDIEPFPFMEGIDSLKNHHKLPARFALVIGVDRYVGAQRVTLPDLPAVVNDANSVAGALTDAGFSLLDGHVLTQDVIKHPVRKADILAAVAQLANIAKQSKVDTSRDPIVLVYFAGHGLVDESEDYILPADFNPYFAEDVKDMSVSVKQILQRLQMANPALRIIVTDSCRSEKPIVLQSFEHSDIFKTIYPGGNPAASNQDISVAPEGSKIIYSTLRNATAGGDGEKGRFTGEFVNQLEYMYDRIKHLRPGEVSGGANLSNIIGQIEQLMNVPGNLQIAEDAGTTPDFNFFPNNNDFRSESKLWDYYTHDSSKIILPTSLDYNMSQYCGYESFLRNTSVLSFYGDAARQVRTNYSTLLKSMTGNYPDCKKWRETLNAASANAITKLDTGIWSNLPQESAARSGPVAAPAPKNIVQTPPPPTIDYANHFELTPLSDKGLDASGKQGNDVQPGQVGVSTGEIPLRSTKPTVVSDVLQSTILSVEAKKELASFDPTTPLENLAVTVARVNITASLKSNSPVKTTVEPQQFVQIIRVVSDYVEVRTGSHVEGFMPGKLLDPAKIAETFDIDFNEDGINPDFANRLSLLLQHAVLTDAVVQYNSYDKAFGLTRAQDVASVVSSKSRSATLAGVFAPKIFGDASIPSRTVRLIVVAFGLDKDVRDSSSAISVSGASVPLDLAAQAGDAVQSDSARSPDCLRPEKNLKGSDLGTLAYIQYDGSRDQYALSARVISALKAAGFNKTLPEKVGSPLLPRVKGEVRQCPQFPPTLSITAVNALRICGLGEYRAVTLPVSLCQKVSARNVEIWLARGTLN